MSVLVLWIRQPTAQCGDASLRPAPAPLRALPVMHALPLRGLHLSTSQCRGFEHPLVAHGRFLVGLLLGGLSLAHSNAVLAFARLNHGLTVLYGSLLTAVWPAMNTAF